MRILRCRKRTRRGRVNCGSGEQIHHQQHH
jgi:hypothetical protein